MYILFSKSLQGSKGAITMRPVSIESTLLLFLLIQNFLGLIIRRSVRLLSQSTSKNEKYLLSRYKRKIIKRFFHIWFVFVTWGLRLNSIKIFCLTDRITIKTYDINRNAPLLQTYKEATSFELYLKMLQFQKQPFKQLL